MTQFKAKEGDKIRLLKNISQYGSFNSSDYNENEEVIALVDGFENCSTIRASRIGRDGYNKSGVVADYTLPEENQYEVVETKIFEVGKWYEFKNFDNQIGKFESERHGHYVFSPWIVNKNELISSGTFETSRIDFIRELKVKNEEKQSYANQIYNDYIDILKTGSTDNCLVAIPPINDHNITNKRYWEECQKKNKVVEYANLLNKNSTYYSSYISRHDLSLKVNKSGDTMTGSLFQDRNNAHIGSLSFVDLTPLGGGNVGRTLSLFGLNRIYNESALAWTGGTYYNNSGIAMVVDSYNNSLAPPRLSFASFLPNQNNTYSYWLQSDKNSTNLLSGNLTITNISGSCNAYACLDVNGKLYRGNPTC